MERHDLNLISKKRRIDSKSEGDSKVVESISTTKKFADSIIYRLYFKSLMSDETTGDKKRVVKVGFGIAICDEADNLFYEMKESLNSTRISREEVEIIALITELNNSIQLGLRNVVICCDDHQIYQIILGRENPMQKIVYLVEEFLHLRGKLASCEVVLVAPNDVKFAFRLARDAIVSESSSSSVDVKAPEGETCAICLRETDDDLMFFSTDKCFHRHCVSCVKKYVEVKLLSGILPTCLEYGCPFELTLENCSKVLTPKLIEMWKQRSKEDLIPAAEKIYCPYPSCSMLMSRTELSTEADQSNVRACVKCCGLFCIDCKVPSHSGLSCADYKKLHPEPLVDDMKLKSLANDNMWRQCVQCRHLIERYHGCNHMTCRCGYEFCYICGVEWNKIQRTCPSGCLSIDHDDDDYDDDDNDDDDDDDDDDNDDDDDGSKYSREAELDGIDFEDYAVYQPYDPNMSNEQKDKSN